MSDSGEGGGRRRGSSASSGRGRQPEACPTRLWLPTVVWRCAECVYGEKRAQEISIYRRGRGGDGDLAGALWSVARRRMASVRGGEDAGDHAGAVDEQLQAQKRGTRRAQGHGCTVALAASCLCLLRRAPASASARAELRGCKQGWWRGLARCCSRGSEHARNRGSSAPQSAERVGRMPTPLDERRHRVNFGIGLS